MHSGQTAVNVAFEKVPTGQLLQEPAPKEELVPAGQGRHGGGPPGEKVPGAHLLIPKFAGFRLAYSSADAAKPSKPMLGAPNSEHKGDSE